jgi:acyl-CoA thioester hydrolase
VHEVRLRLRWRDMDAYGHVNNAVYLNFLEEARDAWVEDVLGSVADDVWHFVLARVAIDFRGELKQVDGEIIVRCRLESIGRSSIRTREEIRKLDGSVAAEAAAVIVPRDPERGTSRPLTMAERVALERELSDEG